jgi:glycoprotein 2-beta-D-xylosyltransferase
MSTYLLLVLLLGVLVIYFATSSGPESPPSSLSSLDDTLAAQALEIAELRTAIHAASSNSNNDNNNPEISAMLDQWMASVKERDEIILKLQHEAIEDEAALAAVLEVHEGVKEKIRGIATGVQAPQQQGKTTTNPPPTNPPPANLPPAVVSSAASDHDTSSCAIAWSVPSSLEDYFFPTSTSSPVSQPPPSSCVTHPILNAVRCYISDLTIYNEKIDVAYGGEPIAEVMGQIEDVEYAKYSVGAFTLPERNSLPVDKLSHGWYLNKVLAGSTTGRPPAHIQCDETPTLLITRYEYVNLFHTSTDWWTVYESVPQQFWLENGKLNVIWLDGHAQGNLDPVWDKAFGPSTPVKHLPSTGACFKKAVIVPAGYTSPLWFNNRRWREPPCIQAANAFADHMLKSFGLSEVRRVPRRVVLIDRVPYTAHPRSAPGHMPRTLKNIESLREAVERAGGEVKVVRFEQLSFGEQLLEVREADVLVGIHGAGLSHVLFMSPGSTMVELQTNSLGMFSGFATWRPEVEFVSVRIGEGNGRSYDITEAHIKSVVKLIK